MDITKVTYYDINKKGKGKFLAKCSIVLDDCLVLHDIKLLNGDRGRYVIMPSKAKNPSSRSVSMNNTKEDLFHPVEKSYFAYMLEIILKGYEVYEDKGSYVYIPK